MLHNDARLAQRLRQAMPPVPAASPDLRRRIAALTDEAPVGPGRWRWVPLTAALAASALLWVATPHVTGGVHRVASAEESFVWETFTALDDAFTADDEY